MGVFFVFLFGSEKMWFRIVQFLSRGKAHISRTGRIFDRKTRLVLGFSLGPKKILRFSLGPKKGPQIETLHYLSRGRSLVSGSVVGALIWLRNLCKAGPKFWPESRSCFTLSEYFCLILEHPGA